MSDFDDIFGDLKEDQHVVPSLTADFDADSIFGDGSLSGPTKPSDLSAADKPREALTSSLTASSSPPAPVLCTAAHREPLSADEQQADNSASARGGSGEQDDFLSWLDDAPKPAPASGSVRIEEKEPATGVKATLTPEPTPSLDDPSSSTAAAVSPLPVQPSPSVGVELTPSVEVDLSPPMDTVSLDEVETVALDEVETVKLDEVKAVSLEEVTDVSAATNEHIEPARNVAVPTINIEPVTLTVAPPCGEISLDDDDDDDDFLEKIVQNANKKQQAGSREASSSSLAIKSHNQAQYQPQIDAQALLKAYLETGTVPPASRLALWKFCVQEPTKGEPLSMYALQTTPLDLSSQALLRKEVESLCSAIFASKTHREVMEAAIESDQMDGAHLLFLDNAEILVTHLCKSLKLDYTAGLALTFAPLLAAGGSDPLRLELVDALRGVCHRFLPHLGQQTVGDSTEMPATVKLTRIAAARRLLLKQLLLYHSPALARHLEHHFPSWINAVKDGRSVAGSSSTGGAIPDAWLASFFESERYGSSFDFLVKVWDCCLLLDAALGASGRANSQHMSSFVTVHLVMHAEKALMRMEGEQLRHCMAQTLVDGLKASSDAFLPSVRALVEATPTSFVARLCDASKAVNENEAGAGTKVQAPVPTSSATTSTNNGLAAMSSLLTASANGVKELSTAMIDMPAKLLTIVPMKPLSLPGLGMRGEDAVPGQTAQELFFLHAQALAVQPAAMPLATEDVIPLVFRSFQASPVPPSSAKLRFFIVDCRGSIDGGQIPTAFRLDPDSDDASAVELVMSTLLPLKHSAHFVVMGTGFTKIADELRQLPEGQQQQYQQQQAMEHQSADGSTPFAFNEAFLEALARDQRRVNATVEMLTAQGFSKVSVLDGGFASAHALLRHSHEFATADLVDHDASRCTMCAHHERLAVVQGTVGGRSNSGALGSAVEAQQQASQAPGHGSTGGPASSTSSFSTANTLAGDDRSSSRSSSAKTGSARTASGSLDAKALFDSHVSSSSPSPKYLSSFAGALKTGGKTLLNPGDSLKESTKWLMKKSSSEVPVNATTSPTNSGGSGSPAVALGIGGLSKLRNSLAHIGSESIDMLRKAEQAATAKSRLPFGSPASSSPAGKPPSGHAGHPAASSRTGSATSSPSVASASTGGVGRPASGTGGDRHGSFQPSEEEVFTIDDDDEEEQDDFVGGGGGAHAATSSTSSQRNGSFQRDGSVPEGATPNFVLHDVVKGHVSDLHKGMRVSRTQMLPCVESPFFSGYKKKKAGDKAVMLPRRLVLMENFLVVLKAERGADDVYMVKSCHPLAHLARMTCLKKNALMVTVYYKWKPSEAGDFVERRNAYEVQQRDEFIRAIKSAMDKM